MKLLSRKILLPMAAVAVIGAGAYGVSQASAATDTTAGGPETLVQRLADTFHLDKSKVQAVFDQNRTAHQADREAKYEARLTQAVTDGKLTAAQKSAIIAEHNQLAAEMKTAMDASSSQTPAERRAAMDKIRTEGQDWATAGNIDQKWLMGPGGPHLRGGRGMMGDPGDGPAPDAPAGSASSSTAQ